MKPRIALLLACSPLIGISAAQTTQSYTDTTGDIDPGVGTLPHLDITSVDVTVDVTATFITFRINLDGSPLDSPNGTNWGKYLVAIRSGAGGATAGNAWTRPINFAAGMTHWIGTWADAGGDTCGGGTSSYTAPTWNGVSGPTVTKDATGITIVETVANLALGPGEVFSFDVYTSGGGNPDSAVDALSASAASITGWAGPYTTNAVGAGTNAARQFTMPGISPFTTWVGGFGLAPADQDPGDDPDLDGLTNQQEFDADLDLNPNSDDTDADNLTDNLEDGTMVYNGPSDPGTFPAIADSDGDGHTDGDEVNGTSSLGFVSDPTVRNFATMTVAGSFPANPGEHWAADGSSIGTDMTRTVDVDLTGQFGWTLDYHVTALGTKAHKFVGDHNWNNSWGTGGAGGTDVNFTYVASGFHRWSFNSKTTAFSLARVSFPDQAAFLTAYGLSAGADEDLDGINNEAEFALMTDPRNSDTDGDGLNDLADGTPLAPAARDIVFSVNMNVQTALGNFIPGVDTVVVDFFNGLAGPLGDLALSDGNNDGIWTGTLTAFSGPVGTSFGTYKFRNSNPSAPATGYEGSINDREFNLVDLEGAGTTQTLATVFFDNNSTMPPGYSSWAGLNVGGAASNVDTDLDGVTNGVEYFMNSAAGFTANPPVVVTAGPTRSVTWPNGGNIPSAAYGTQFVVQTSPNLATWTNVDGSDVNLANSAGSVTYTITGAGKQFVRLAVTPN
jgi:hypothetical protein